MFPQSTKMMITEFFLPNRLGIGPIFDPLMTSKNNKKRWADAITIDFREGQIFRALVPARLLDTILAVYKKRAGRNLLFSTCSFIKACSFIRDTRVVVSRSACNNIYFLLSLR